MAAKIVVTMTDNNRDYGYNEEQNNIILTHKQYFDSVLNLYGGSSIIVGQNKVFSFSTENDARNFVRDIYNESNLTISNYLTMRRNISNETGYRNILKYDLFIDGVFLETIKSIN